jgi:uncharacterized membrane protein YozB (DUF420 family)
MTTSQLPDLNASLNSICTVLLLAGYIAIRRRRVGVHRACMIAALATSVLFLASYLVYHYQVGSVRYTGQGWIRTVYFSVLISHSLLAAIVAPMTIITTIRALRGRFAAHRRLARWTLPIWLYVSVTGVVVYWLLYRM